MRTRIKISGKEKRFWTMNCGELKPASLIYCAANMNGKKTCENKWNLFNLILCKQILFYYSILDIHMVMSTVFSVFDLITCYYVCLGWCIFLFYCNSYIFIFEFLSKHSLFNNIFILNDNSDKLFSLKPIEFLLTMQITGLGTMLFFFILKEKDQVFLAF